MANMTLDKAITEYIMATLDTVSALSRLIRQNMALSLAVLSCRQRSAQILVVVDAVSPCGQHLAKVELGNVPELL